MKFPFWEPSDGGNFQLDTGDGLPSREGVKNADTAYRLIFGTV